MNDEHSHQAHRHLHHLIGVRVVHEAAAFLKLELIDEGLIWRDVRLRDATDAIHAVWQQHSVPMDRGVLRQFVGDEDPNLVSFDRLDRRTRRLSVVAPKMHIHSRRKLANNRFRDKMKLLPIAIHPPRQGPAV